MLYIKISPSPPLLLFAIPLVVKAVRVKNKNKD